MTEEPIPVRKNSQHMIMGPEKWGGLRHKLCKDLISATVQDITYPWQSVYSDKYMFSVSEKIGRSI